MAVKETGEEICFENERVEAKMKLIFLAEELAR